MTGWRYFATRVHGNGAETLLASDLPLKDVTLTFVLSGVNEISASVPVEIASLKRDSTSRSMFVPWSTAIYAEKDGQIRAAGIVTDVTIDEPSLKIQCDGFVGYLHGTAYMDVQQFVNADPLDIARHMWAHVQGKPNGNLGLRLNVDPPTSPIRLGRLPVEQWPTYTDGKKAPALPPVGAQFKYTWPPAKPGGKQDVVYCTSTRSWTWDGETTIVVRDKATGVLSQKDTSDALPAGSEIFGTGTSKAPKVDESDGVTLEPYRLEWFTDSDLGQRWDDLATQGHFDYAERHEWSGQDIIHTLDVAYGGLGRKRDDLRFVVGENVQVVPQLELAGEDYFSEVTVIGAGEGRAAPRATWPHGTTRLRRTRIVKDPSLRTQPATSRRASEITARAAEDEQGDIKQLVVRDHGNARMGSWSVGDSLRVIGPVAGWTSGLDLWVRVLSYTISPEQGDVATMTVTRTERSQP